VQGRADPQREILDVESVEAMFADLFRAGGRPSIPAEVMASVIVLQTLHGLSDNEAVEAVTFDLRWKAACGLAVTDPGVSSDDAGLLAASAGPLTAPESDLRRGQAGGGRDRGAGREDPSGVGLHGVG